MTYRRLILRPPDARLTKHIYKTIHNVKGEIEPDTYVAESAGTGRFIQPHLELQYLVISSLPDYCHGPAGVRGERP
ncbi:hypothetical protein RSOLAG1IB_09906 [Rhizoctonia solani AG-1 IB]|uniref:Uncharacterized protein n=1 Tax=Thanatephorus cucumeris (strain AG1-IB / isolate 7/3/14) TaxID=1108050 RepID=A0A0B7FWL0_THACB|nr:hypothetical protein RSOLAG1IB_09906 [Rhizoctonia solani AG-1 IB]